MATWGELLADIRTELRDADPDLRKRRWSDEDLYLFTRDAIRDYSQHLPRRADRTPLARQGAAYPLPGDFIDVIFLECPAGSYLEKRVERPGTRRREASPPRTFHIEAGSLYLDGAPPDGAEALLTYRAAHPAPAGAADTGFALTIPDGDAELVRLYVKAKVVEQLRVLQAALDRFKPGAGDRQDNPLGPEYEHLMGAYFAKLADRTGGQVIWLYRPGRMA